MANRRHNRLTVLSYGNTDSWSKSLTDYIFDRDEGKCIYCGELGTEIDHVIPYPKGGPTIRANGVVACKSCNARKSGDISMEYISRGFYYLAIKGESLSWVDEFWEQLPRMRGTISEEN